MVAGAPLTLLSPRCFLLRIARSRNDEGESGAELQCQTSGSSTSSIELIQAIIAISKYLTWKKPSLAFSKYCWGLKFKQPSMHIPSKSDGDNCS